MMTTTTMTLAMAVMVEIMTMVRMMRAVAVTVLCTVVEDLRSDSIIKVVRSHVYPHCHVP